MSKYKILRLFGLRELLSINHREVYSPEGYELTVVSNGLLGGQLLYDYKNKKVYGLCLKEIPDLTEENIKSFDHAWARENIAFHMSGEAMLELIEKKESKK